MTAFRRTSFASSRAAQGRERQFEPVTSSRSAVAWRPTASSLVDRQLLRSRREMRMRGDVDFQGTGESADPKNRGGRQRVELVRCSHGSGHSCDALPPCPTRLQNISIGQWTLDSRTLTRKAD
jgi:hypothetical protein